MAVVMGWILLNGPTALTNVEQLLEIIPQKFAKLRNWYDTDQTWSGAWTNEGDVTDQPEMYVTLELDVSRSGSVGGVIRSSGFPGLFPLNLC